MVDTDKRAKATAALETYVEVADHLREQRAAVAFSVAATELKREKAQAKASEKAALEKQLHEAEAAVAKCDAEQAQVSAKIAHARGEGDVEAAHKGQLKSQSLTWARQEAARARAGIIAKLAAQPPASDAWYGSKEALWEAWRSVDFGPDHQKIFDLLVKGEWRDLPDDEPVSVRFLVASGEIVEYAPRKKEK